MILRVNAKTPCEYCCLISQLFKKGNQLPGVVSIHTSSVNKWQNYENERHFEPGEDVLKRVAYGLSYDFKRWTRRYKEARYDAFKRRNPIAHMKHSLVDLEVFPYRAEVLIIGGGLVGSSAAYWIKEKFRDEDFKVVVVENNDKFSQTSSLLSCGTISQQFSLAEHVEMSLFTAEFLRHAGEHLRILDNDRPDVSVLPLGFMYLACTEEDANKLNDNWKLQIEKGARIALMNKTELQQRFPFMNFDDVLLGTYGLENEGIIDPWQLLAAIREKNITLGVQYVKGAVEGFMFEKRHGSREIYGFEDDELADELNYRNQQLTGAYIRPQMTDASARPIRTHIMLCAAGPWAGKVAKMAGIGYGKGLMNVPIPIVSRMRTSFVIYAPDVPAVDMPALMEPNGVSCIQEEAGNTFICSKTPTSKDDKHFDTDKLDVVDNDIFYEQIWPVLVKRIPLFKNAKIKNAWTSYEDVNTFDGTPIIGEHLLYNNLHFMCGFGNRNMQHALAAGRAFSEKVLEGAYTSINLRKFDMRRILRMEKLCEAY